MLLAYVDESFSSDLYYLGAMVLAPETAHSITHDLEHLAARIRTRYGFLDRPEFHGYEMFHGESGWKHMKKMVRARVGIYNDVVDIVARPGVTFIVRCISKRGLDQRYSTPYPREQVAWQFLLQDVNGHCESRFRDLALVIADQVSEDEARRRDLARMRVHGTFGDYRKSTLPAIIDTIHFAPSHHSRLIQAIDCALFIIQRKRAGIESDPRAIAQLERIYGKLDGESVLLEYGRWP